MKPKFIKLSVVLSTFLFAFVLMPALSEAAGHIAPTGVTETQASQLIFWYDEEQGSPTESSSWMMITNGSTDTAVNIHVQIFADNTDVSTDLCREHNFTDTLTASDTVIYELGNLNQDSSCDVTEEPCGNNVGAPIPIDLDETRGFIVVTAVNQVTLPRQAISHNFLFGTIDIIAIFEGADAGLRTNGMGRRALNFADGSEAAQGVLLDGVTTGLQLLQPSLLSFNFGTCCGDKFASINSITFTDVYSDPNSEYRATPSTVTWNPLIFDELEVGTSCEQHVNTCFVSHGLNDNITSAAVPFTSSFNLCPANFDEIGWVKMDVSGLSGLANNVGVTAFTNFDSFSEASASWMMAQ